MRIQYYNRWVLSAIVLLALALLVILPASQAATTEGPFIHLEYATFDPLEGELQFLDAPEMAAADDTDIWLIQFTGPVLEAWKERAEAVGVQLYGYVPDYAFIVRMDATTVAQVETLPFVRWIGPYHPAYRLAPAFHDPALGTEPITVNVQTLPDVELESLIRRVENWGGVVEDTAQSSLAKYLRIQLTPDHIEALARQPDVLWIEPYFVPELHNDVAGGTIMRANQVRSSLNLYGAGQIVAVADSGLDMGTTGPEMSADFRGRIVAGQAICAFFSGGRTTWSDLNAHGTHVAGSVLGSGQMSGSNPATNSYGDSFAGVAPAARLIVQSLDDDGDSMLECVPNDLANRLFGPAYDLGARIHTNSWGGPTGGTQQNPQYGGYTTNAQKVDDFIWQHPEMLILYSAGNSGRDANADGVVDLNSISSPGTSKNVLTVGATENLRPTFDVRWGNAWPTLFPTDPIASDWMADHAAGMAAFSGRGPTSDGRIKPEVVAPGTAIISARSQHPSAGTGWREFNEHYLYMGGTSMSTPLVAGGAALMREWLTRVRSVGDPSAALLKAFLINGATNIAPGQYGTGSKQEIPNRLPNNVAGWGRVDLMQSLNPPSPQQIWFKDEKTGLQTGESAVFMVTIGVTTTAAQHGQANARSDAPSLDVDPADAEVFQHAAPSASQPLGTTQLLQNRGFETGAWEPWQTYGSPYLTNTVKRTGNWSAHLGDRNDANDQFWQAVNIAADASAVEIDFWHRLQTHETSPGYDFFCYGLWHETGSPSYLVRCTDFALTGNTPGWVQETYKLDAEELAQVAGEQVLVGFLVQTDALLPSRAWVDDTALNLSSDPVTPTPTPTPLPDLGTEPLRIVLTWTDYPAQPSSSKALVNDLDLEIVAPDGTRYIGNQGLYTSGPCLRDGRWDACNNVEGVIIPGAPLGTYQIIVRGANIPQGPQPFALVATGDTLREGMGSLAYRVFVPSVQRKH